ncbi:hypothetical protein Leryth_010347 [Lithospermum erythrorhizon]|nr:hypothetical protein Leryth_010347 [Lithospermum erythrorhizon]
MSDSSTPQKSTPTRPLPFREDCWTETATSTLIDSWGRRYLELNRGNLRQKDWQEVADAVNALHGHTKKTIRTDVQCKNRIDTLKKKYKVEKAKVVESNGGLKSSWCFFERLDFLIGTNYDKLNQNRENPNKLLDMGFSDSPPMGVPLPYGKTGLSAAVVQMQTPPQMLGYPQKRIGAVSQTPPQMLGLPQKRGGAMVQMPPHMLGLLQKRDGAVEQMQTRTQMLSLPQKRGGADLDGSDLRRNYSAMAAAAAKPAMEEEDEEGSEEEEEVEEEGVRKLAKAIERFGEVYERVEEMKQRQMVELEKQRMQFTKDLEVQRMQLFMDTQVQLEKIKRAKYSGGGSADGIELNISEIF